MAAKDPQGHQLWLLWPMKCAEIVFSSQSSSARMMAASERGHHSRMPVGDPRATTMNSVGAPAQNKRPPEKGSFPLDHYGECKPKMKEFLACLRDNKASHIDCKHLSKAYLECRMERGLMQEEELDNLGFHEKGMQKSDRPRSYEGRKEGEGFVAGLGVKAPRYKD